MKQLSFVIILIVSALSTVACQNEAAPVGKEFDYEVLSKEAYQKMLEENGEEVILVDVRTPEEYEDGHLEGAKNIDFLNPPVFDEAFSQLDTTKTLMIYCRSGNRSHKSAEKLKEMGFKKIYDLKGGYTAWQEE